MTVGLLRAVIRCDASPGLGGGHLRRCLTLGQALRRRGCAIQVATRSETLALYPDLADDVDGVICLDGPVTDEPWMISRALTIPADLLIVDHYAHDRGFENACRVWARRILVIDDLADRPHDADILTDDVHGRDSHAYRDLVRHGCRVLLGGDYALIDPAFATVRQASLARRKQRQPLRRVFIGFGLADAVNATGAALAGVANSGLDVEVDVVLGHAAPHLARIQAEAKAMPVDVRVHVACDRVAELMAGADVAIGGAGMMSWERCCLGLPSLIVSVADNQTSMAHGLAVAGACANLGVLGPGTALALAEVLNHFARDSDGAVRMASVAATLCDGLGAERLVNAIVQDWRESVFCKGEIQGDRADGSRAA